MKLTTIALSLALAPLAFGAVYEIDPSHSQAQFQVRHMMISNVRGEFNKVAGTVDYDPSNPANSRIEATVDATTINTREPKRDEHLRSAEFFDVAKFPTLTFVSKKVTPNGPGKLKVSGDLTIHGVTRTAVLDVTNLTGEVKDPWGVPRVGASATTVVNRNDFGLTWNKAIEAGGVLVGDEVTINLEIELTKKK
jgi:polyisoprenoid-binding protein YceI